MVAAGVVTVVATAASVGPASADHPASGHEQGCREPAPHPHPYVKIVAEDNTFDAECLMAPADKRFRIYLQNRDSDEHNLSIYSADPDKDKKAEQLFKGRAVKGGLQEDYAVHALPPGEYFFRDDKFKEMNGVIRVPKKED